MGAKAMACAIIHPEPDKGGLGKKLSENPDGLVQGPQGPQGPLEKPSVA
jgi:hypothetical protein